MATLFLKFHTDCIAASYSWCEAKTKVHVVDKEERSKGQNSCATGGVNFYTTNIRDVILCRYVDMLNFAEQQWHISTTLNGVTYVKSEFFMASAMWTSILAYRF
jgi:hypothetical protein